MRRGKTFCATNPLDAAFCMWADSIHAVLSAHDFPPPGCKSRLTGQTFESLNLLYCGMLNTSCPFLQLSGTNRRVSRSSRLRNVILHGIDTTCGPNMTGKNWTRKLRVSQWCSFSCDEECRWRCEVLCCRVKVLPGGRWIDLPVEGSANGCDSGGTGCTAGWRSSR